MDDLVLEQARWRLAELNKLIGQAEHPGAYVNSLAEERRSVQFNIQQLRGEAEMDRTKDLGQLLAEVLKK